MDKKNFQLMIGGQIRLHRKAQGLSQEKLAEIAEVHPTFISNIERGKVSASAFSLYRVAHALGIKLADLFGSLDRECNLEFENDVVGIIGKIKQMDQAQRGLYLAAFKGMLQK
jgi:transcriptional regulator with XRE-family HTH domain